MHDNSTNEEREYFYFEPGTSGKLLIPNLNPGSSYTYQLIIKDLSGNQSSSGVIPVSTLNFDAAPPMVLSNRVIERTSTSAKIEVVTDETANRIEVWYREKGSSTWLTMTVAPFAPSVIVSVSNLVPGKQYEYLVRTKDVLNNTYVTTVKDL